MQVLTFGHSTAAAEKIARLLRGAEVRRVVDVRTAPTSRDNPDATRDAMSRWLPEVGMRPNPPSPQARLLPESRVLVYDAGQPPLVP